ncbi:helix-hairpin-helix domain-containing protein [Chitinimonas sp. BJYL2]|uniref:helix-hairpin-helix domain-containing protein n=1 Tax=Chitinimonas sp. BJYL2 TaxID=2976696 RepID=UPI0022B3E971|nr:helix-hairpin-helix domain-containing protein [Chitinimonas sp. BJYL2]
MTPAQRNAMRLEDLPNVGPATAADLRLLGIESPANLVGQDAYQLYARLCTLTGQQHDPCVIDVLLAAVHFADTGEARRWWSFTPERKRTLAALTVRV